MVGARLERALRPVNIGFVASASEVRLEVVYTDAKCFLPHTLRTAPDDLSENLRPYLPNATCAIFERHDADRLEAAIERMFTFAAFLGSKMWKMCCPGDTLKSSFAVHIYTVKLYRLTVYMLLSADGQTITHTRISPVGRAGR